MPKLSRYQHLNRVLSIAIYSCRHHLPHSKLTSQCQHMYQRASLQQAMSRLSKSGPERSGGCGTMLANHSILELPQVVYTTYMLCQTRAHLLDSKVPGLQFQVSSYICRLMEGLRLWLNVEKAISPLKWHLIHARWKYTGTKERDC